VTGDRDTIRVCVVTPDFYRSSGVTMAMRRIHSGVAAAGGIEHLFVSGPTELPEDVGWIPPSSRSRFDLMSTNPMHLARELARFVRWTRRERVDVVHSHHRRLAMLLAPLSGVGGYRVVYTAQLTYDFSPVFWIAAPRRVTAISPSVSHNIERTTRRRPRAMIGNPSDFPVLPPDAAPTEDAVVCVARLEPVKAHETLLRAWARLVAEGRDTTLALIGEGSLERELRDLAAALGIERLVDFRGYTSDVAGAHDRARFAILASEREGHPVAVVEAAARARPTLVTDVDGSRDCIPPAAELPNRVPFGDELALAEALETWLAAPDAAARDGARFFDFHRARYSTEVIGRRYSQLYREAAGRERRAVG
jgi:glycosyltransferase involved in cell wall biosynthesis